MSADEHVVELLDAYLDGELTPAERAEVETRLAASPALRAELREAAAVRDAVRALPVLDLPPDVVAAVRDERADPPNAEVADELAARRGRDGRRSWRGAGLVAGGAAAAIVLVAAVFPGQAGVKPRIATMVRAHAAGASESADPISVLAPVAQPVRFGR
ncbi:MAG: zf-HC2 domain-containing protein [Acidimicrobiia bacterium]